MSSNRILLACPEEWNTQLSEHLNNKGFDVITAFAYSVAFEIIQKQELSAVVLISDWAMKQDDGSPGLMEFLKDRIPTYSLITYATMQKVGYDWFDKLYKGRKHEYQSMPADIDAIVVWLNQIIDNES